MGGRGKDRELHWRGVLQRQAKSGLSVAEFCRQESILGPSFYAWRRRLKVRDATAEQENQPVAPQPSNAGQLLPVRIESVGQSESVRILLRQGVSLDVPSSIAPSSLTELLSALREAAIC